MRTCILTEDEGVIYESELTKIQIVELLNYAETLAENEAKIV